jgi:hypothetical protein
MPLEAFLATKQSGADPCTPRRATLKDGTSVPRLPRLGLDALWLAMVLRSALWLAMVLRSALWLAMGAARA